MGRFDPYGTADVLTLTLKRYAQQFIMEKGFAGDVDLRMVEDLMGRQAYQMVTKVLADELPPKTLTQSTTVTFHSPASTWQMWKSRNADKWYARKLVARWPVQFATLKQEVSCTFDLERFRTYPKARIPVPDERFGLPTYGYKVYPAMWTGVLAEGADPQTEV